MLLDPPSFDSLDFDEPDLEETVARYGELYERFSAAESAPQQRDVIVDWDSLLRELRSWISLTHLRFAQDTTDPDYKAARERCDAKTTRFTELADRFKRLVLESPHRDELRDELGDFAFERWRADLATFAPAIEETLTREKNVKADYTELMASAKISFRGEELNLSKLRKHTLDRDRETRHEAQRARWSWFAERGARFDEIYGDLVGMRDSMARELGHENFVAMGYERMQRIDYDEEMVARFRQEVRDLVVPLATELREAQRERLGVDELMFWDEPVLDPQGPPTPGGDMQWQVERAQQMFDEMHEELGTFFGLMREQDYLDLEARDGKAGGGFCTSFPSVGMPFIFANFNGTKGDAEVFTHEMGHAFQNWKAGDKALSIYHWPTMESAEIHSMSLEFLCWPHMEKFFGDDADRFRRQHLAGGLLFLPYGVAVDHFQHLVYREPEASPERRREMWRQMEETYLPWRAYGDLEHVDEGGFWHRQGHIFGGPFYYIDYTLAQAVAMQFWRLSEEDYDEALERYVRLCARGGEAPFLDLIASAGLSSPFEPGCLQGSVEAAREVLEV